MLQKTEYLYEFGPFSIGHVSAPAFEGGNSLYNSPRKRTTSLVVLVENNGRLLTKSELMRRRLAQHFCRRIQPHAADLDDPAGARESARRRPLYCYCLRERLPVRRPSKTDGQGRRHPPRLWKARPPAAARPHSSSALTEAIQTTDASQSSALIVWSHSGSGPIPA